MTERRAIRLHINENLHRIEVTENFLRTNSDADDKVCKENIQILTKINGALQEIQQYRAIGTVDEIQNMKKEEDILKFYYCESEDEYYIGKRNGTMYYAKYHKTGFTWFMSRYLPWGEHVVAPETLWKEHTYPSEPKEIPFFEWLQGFMKKECLGTVEECRVSMEKQRARRPQKVKESKIRYTDGYICPSCGGGFAGTGIAAYCYHCGQALDWEQTQEVE